MTKNTKIDVKRDKATPAQAAPPSTVGWPFASLRHEIDRLFDDFNMSGWGWPVGREGAPGLPSAQLGKAFQIAPAMDLVESNGEYEIEAELPGMDAEDVEIRISNGYLTIKGEKSEKSEKKEKNYHLSERSYGEFKRMFQLPSGVDQDKIKANVSKGVLHVHIPKSEEAKQQERSIKVESK